MRHRLGIIQNHDRARLLIYIVTALTLSGCAGRSGSSPYPGEGETGLKSLAGVDSLVLENAQALVDSAFVSVEREEEADKLLEEGKQEFSEGDTLQSLKKILDLARDTTLQVTADDSAKAISYLNRAFGEYEEIEKLFDQYQERGGTSEALGGTILKRLNEARDITMQSVRYNPFDMDARLLLSVIYRYLARIFGDEENYREAIRVLNELIEMDKGDHALYYELGYNQYQLEEWESALTAFQRAEELLFEDASLETDEVSGDVADSILPGAGESLTGGEDDSHQTSVESVTPVAVDTATLLNYVWYQADCLARLYRSGEALDSYARALVLAASDEDREELKGSIDWIEWDGGNIHNVEARDSLVQVEKSGDYRKARDGYFHLLPLLGKTTAVDEIDWKVATIDYQFLDEKDAGITRLRRLIDRAIGRGDLTPAGVVTDSLLPYGDYVYDYGIMCFNLGMDYLTEKRQRKEAFAYFLQASEMEWQNRASSFVELLKLASNNPNMTINYGEKALESDISREDRMYVLKQLTTAYKRKGTRADFEKARGYFNEWKRLTKREK